MTNKDLKRQVWGLLEDYGLFKEEWHRDTKVRFLKDFVIIAERYRMTQKNGK